MSDEAPAARHRHRPALPTLLAGPLLFLLLWKMRQLAIAHREMTELATMESLTAVLNRGAFKMLVDAYLEQAAVNSRHGALLIVDADHFKSINDQFGHDWGDRALQLIAAKIFGEVKAPDLVGRIGGEEFGIFLQSADPAQAWNVAERIRLAVNHTEIVADGMARTLSVSVGGATFAAGDVSYDEVFVLADRQLYRAKWSGRNRVSLASIGQVDGPVRRAMTPDADNDAGSDGQPRPAQFQTTLGSILHSTRTHLNMQVAYIAEFVGDVMVIARWRARTGCRSTKAARSRCATPMGRHRRRHAARADAGCLRPSRGRGQAVHPRPGVRAHVGVPILMPNGDVYGLLGCFSGQPDASLTSAT